MENPDKPFFDVTVQESTLLEFLKSAQSDPIKFPPSFWKSEHVDRGIQLLLLIDPPSCHLPAKSSPPTSMCTFAASAAREKKYDFATATVLSLLEFLKMLSRIQSLNSSMYEEKAMKIFGEFAGIYTVEHPAAGPEIYDSPISREAMKILNNLLLLKQSTIDTYANPKLLKGLVLLTKKEKLSIEAVFLVYRLLFLYSCTGTQVSFMESQGGIGAYTQTLRTILEHEERETVLYVNAVCEVLKALFNFLRFGTHQDALLEQNLGTAVLHAWAVQPHWPMSPPHSHAIHLFLYDPAYRWYHEDTVAFLCTRILAPCLHRLLGKTPVRACPERETALVPLFHLFTQTAKHHARLLRQFLAPASKPRPVLTEHLISLFTCAEMPVLKTCVEELMPALFEDKMPDLVEYTGLGPVAGMLVNRKILTPEVLSKLKSPETSDEEPAWKKMSEEEREREADKIFNGLERLSQLGFITAVNPETGEPLVPGKVAKR